MGLIQAAPPALFWPSTRRNVVLNGSFDLWGRGTTAAWSGTNAWKLADNWFFTNATDATGTTGLSATGPANTGFMTSQDVVISTADASLGPTQYMYFGQRIEGYLLRRLLFQPITISFWVWSTKTGTYSFAFNKGMEASDSRSWVDTFTINQANTWEKKVITIPAFNPSTIGGTWNLDWSTGAQLCIGLAWGSNYQTSNLRTWLSTPFYAAPGCVNFADTAGGSFRLTGVQVEPGAIATPYDHMDIALMQTACLRYFETIPYVMWCGAVTASALYYSNARFAHSKRIVPVAGNFTLGIITVSGFPSTAPAYVSSDSTQVLVSHTAVGTGSSGFFAWSAQVDTDLVWGT